MDVIRSSASSPYSTSRPGARVLMAHEEERRAARSTHLASGSLACAQCDAPVAIGPGGLSPAELISCPFCQRRAPLREFLSLAAPSRPARVIVRVSRSALRPA